ncbi:MAG: DUF4249 domain-containing protein [Bacteroidota bacterium]
MKIYPYLFILLLLTACIEPYEVDIPAGERFLVVEGLITDQAEPYVVKLSYSSPVSETNFEPISNASVEVQSEDGQTFPFTLSADGIYVSDSSSFLAVVGQSYRLLLNIGGKSYASTLEQIKRSPPIDSIFWDYDSRVTSEGPVEGVQLFVNTNDPEANSRFYRYQWVETWKYGVLYPANYIYLGNDQSETVQAYPTCYKTESSVGINVASTAQNTEDRLLGHPLQFITTNTNRLDKRYSIFLRQYVMSEQEFLFWKTIKESTENIGSLFDRQPQSRLGNIQNLDDPSEAVLGYFSASGLSTKRIFIDRSELPLGIRVFNGFRECGTTIDTLMRINAGFTQEEIDANVFAKINQGQVFYDFADRPLITGYIFTTPECSDCREQGGTEVKPDFWVE